MWCTFGLHCGRDSQQALKGGMWSRGTCLVAVDNSNAREESAVILMSRYSSTIPSQSVRHFAVSDAVSHELLYCDTPGR